MEQKRPIKNGKEFYTVAKIVHRPGYVRKIKGFPVRDEKDLRNNNEITEGISARTRPY